MSVGRHVEAEYLGGLEVDDKLELGRRLDRQISRLLAAQDAIKVRRSASPQIGYVGAISGQSAGVGEEGERIDCGYGELPL
jgi:hypothetical protein